MERGDREVVVAGTDRRPATVVRRPSSARLPDVTSQSGWAGAEAPAPGEIRLGTQGWSYPEWVGPFYPPGTRQTDLLRQYARVFDTVELDTTFHAIPRREVVSSWRAAVSDGFLFSAKLPRTITHMKRLRGVEPDLEAFLSAMEPLGDRLGVLLVQLPRDFHSDERATLEAFLHQLPEPYRWAIEVRHRSWIHPDVFDLLSRHDIAWTIVDLVGMPTVPEVTTNFAYVRWLGDRNLNPLSDVAEVERIENVDRWSATLRDLSFRADRVYGYVSDTWAGHAPASVRALSERLGLATPGSIPGEEPLQPPLFPDLR